LTVEVERRQQREQPGEFRGPEQTCVWEQQKLLEWTIGRKTPVVDRQIVWGTVSDFHYIQDTLWEVEGVGSSRR
jgi:hypothetical protein